MACGIFIPSLCRWIVKKRRGKGGAKVGKVLDIICESPGFISPHGVRENHALLSFDWPSHRTWSTSLCTSELVRNGENVDFTGGEIWFVRLGIRAVTDHDVWMDLLPRGTACSALEEVKCEPAESHEGWKSDRNSGRSERNIGKSLWIFELGFVQLCWEPSPCLGTSVKVVYIYQQISSIPRHNPQTPRWSHSVCETLI